MIGGTYIKEFLEFLLEKYGETLLSRFEGGLFRIAKSEKLVRFFTLAGFSIFSTVLIFVVLTIVDINEKVRAAEEVSEVSGKLIQASFVRAKDFMALLDDPSEIPTERQVPYFDRILLQAKEKNVTALAVLNNGKASFKFGTIDPSETDPTWNTKRIREIEQNLALLAEPAPKTYLINFERRFRTKGELSVGSNYSGSIVLARIWQTNTNGLVGYIAFFSMNEFSRYLRLTDDDYKSGDYDYLVDQEGNLLSHPELSIVYGTDQYGNKLKNASDPTEVGTLPVNTRDADWIAGSEILNKAFEKMLRGKNSSVVYKNLQNQPRLTSFARIPLDESGIFGLSIGIVSGRGLGQLESFIAPILLESPDSLRTALYAASSIYMILILIWLWFISRLRSLHRDIVSLSPSMNADMARKLRFLPIRNNKIRKQVISDSVLLLVSVEDKNYAKNIIPTRTIITALIRYLHGRNWMIERLGIREFTAFKSFNEAEDEDTAITPSIVLTLFRSKKAVFEILQLIEKSIKGISLSIFYTIGDLTIETLRENDDSNAIVDFSGKGLINLLELQNKGRGRPTPSSNQVTVCYEEEIAREFSLEMIGVSEILDETSCFTLRADLGYGGDEG